jgi:hypothetical protein
MLELKVRHVLSVDPVGVIDAIWSGEEWNKRWESIRSFCIGYDDGFHQVAGITLDWYDTVVEMEVVRFRLQPLRIDFFCPRPPHPLTHQSGRWSVESEDGKNFLVASRRIALALDPTESSRERELRLESYAGKLTERLSLILPRFACVSE